MAACAHSECATPWAVRLLRRGVWFDEAWYCDADCLAAETARQLAALQPPSVTRVPTCRPVRLGTLLVAERHITPAVLTRALEEAARQGVRLGARLVATGAVDEVTLTRTLARQAGVGFLRQVDPDLVRRPVAGLPRRLVEALGVVPTDSGRDGTLHVAVTAPLPRMAIATLQEGTGRRVRPYLVSDSTMAALLEAYGTVGTADGMDRVSPIEAARRIAAAACAGQVERWHHAWGPGFAWVRLAGASGVRDLMVTTSTEQTWQAALTQH